MTVAEMIRELQGFPQELEVWTYGIELDGRAGVSVAQPPTVSTPYGNGIKRVIIDGGCV